jgi:hypothetical protein
MDNAFIMKFKGRRKGSLSKKKKLQISRLQNIFLSKSLINKDTPQLLIKNMLNYNTEKKFKIFFKNKKFNFNN